MKIIINNHQLDLLTSNFVIVEGNGMKSNSNNLISESMKEFKVRILFNGWESQIRIGANSSGSALAIAKLIFKNGIVTGSVKQV